MGTGQSSPNLGQKEQDSQPPQEQDHRPEQQLLAMQPDLSKTSSTNLGERGDAIKIQSSGITG